MQEEKVSNFASLAFLTMTKLQLKHTGPQIKYVQQTCFLIQDSVKGEDFSFIYPSQSINFTLKSIKMLYPLIIFPLSEANQVSILTTAHFSLFSRRMLKRNPSCSFKILIAIGNYKLINKCHTTRKHYLK